MVWPKVIGREVNILEKGDSIDKIYKLIYEYDTKTKTKQNDTCFISAVNFPLCFLNFLIYLVTFSKNFNLF